jgi:hypothetical protein
MGRIAQLNEVELNTEFMATCSDPEHGAEVVFIEHREFGDFISATAQVKNGDLHIQYTLLDDELDDADARALFFVSYLQEFAQHEYREKCERVELKNVISGYVESLPYPD